MPSSTPSNGQERLETPSTLVTLVDRGRPWFTSRDSWEEELLLSAPALPAEVEESEMVGGSAFHASLPAATGQAPERASSVA